MPVTQPWWRTMLEILATLLVSIVEHLRNQKPSDTYLVPISSTRLYTIALPR